MKKLWNDFYPFELLTKHDIIVKNRFKLEDHSFKQDLILSMYITRDIFWPSNMIWGILKRSNVESLEIYCSTEGMSNNYSNPWQLYKRINMQWIQTIK